MKAGNHQIETDLCILNHKVYPGGPKVLLAFHGFGQSAEAMAPLTQRLSQTYTLYSFDLFFHGSSTWKNTGQTLSKQDWSHILSQVLKTYNIASFTLAGFSLGGKLVLATVEAFPTRVERVMLMAPDGIDTSFWYNLATYPPIFRRYFKSMITKPQRFHHLMKALKKLNIVDKGLIRFAARQMNSNSKRYQVYHSWVVFKELKFDLDQIANVLNRQEIPVNIWMGKYDRVIKTRRLEKLVGKLEQCELHFLDCGHNDLVLHVVGTLEERYNL